MPGRRWVLARYGWSRLPEAVRRSRGWCRVTIGVMLVGAVVFGGLIGLLVSILVVAGMLSARARGMVSRWRLRPVARYVEEVEQTHGTVEQQLRWLRRDIERRDEEIARLRDRLACRDDELAVPRVHDGDGDGVGGRRRPGLSSGQADG